MSVDNPFIRKELELKCPDRINPFVWKSCLDLLKGIEMGDDVAVRYFVGGHAMGISPGERDDRGKVTRIGPFWFSIWNGEATNDIPIFWLRNVVVTSRV